MLLLDTKPGIIFSGIVSIGLTIVHLAVAGGFYYYNIDVMMELGKHLCCLQILSSVVLIIGVFKQNHKYFVPWMISTGLFIYMLTYCSTALMGLTINLMLGLELLGPHILFFSCALYAVNKAYDRMREAQSEAKINVTDKKSILSLI